MAATAENCNGRLFVEKDHRVHCKYYSGTEEQHFPRHPYANHACPSMWVIVDDKARPHTHEEFMSMKRIFEQGYEAGRKDAHHLTESSNPTFSLG
jgi:hypothetical protein